MKVIDVSGRIYEGMWGYGPPFPEFKLSDIELPAWVDYKSYAQSFEGFHILTGTYIVMPSHGLGLDRSYALYDIDIAKLYDIEAYVLKFDLERLERQGKNPYITLEDVKAAEKEEIPQQSAIILATGWGSQWGKADYLKNYWFIRKDAYEYILSKRPFLIGMDTPSMDNLNDAQGLSKTFYNNNIILVAPLVNVEKVKSFKVRFTVCPLNVMNTTGAPCRAVIVDEESP